MPAQHHQYTLSSHRTQDALLGKYQQEIAQLREELARPPPPPPPSQQQQQPSSAVDCSGMQTEPTDVAGAGSDAACETAQDLAADEAAELPEAQVTTDSRKFAAFLRFGCCH